MQIVSVFSGAGGVTKTSTAVSLAMVAAESGKATVLIDLDPRAAASTWTRTEPNEPGWTVNAILDAADSEGWAEQLAVKSTWHENFRVIPSEPAVELREKSSVDDMELRLKRSLVGLTADVVVIDCPNRTGGLLLRSALLASTHVVYAADPTEDGAAGVESASESVARFKKSQADRGVSDNLVELGTVVSKYHYGAIEHGIEKVSVDDMEELGTVLYPLIPHQPFILKCRRSGEWYGSYRQGQKLKEAYAEIAGKVFTS